MRFVFMLCVLQILLRENAETARPKGHPGLPWYVHQEHLVHTYDTRHEIPQASPNRVSVNDEKLPYLFVSDLKEVPPDLMRI
ncbi:hypothetical protein EG68_01687 [Paragonimus skrjabini miyazakii]|uniref:Uncharacterized protein n=1 Tax=Paragonimus skrjabini miyazakii TaxID=59628 RepID=A0A8S9ZBY0_9TREM|nr:hypothetical protein EG68_01687 [Paragonimus skrjabini miyazakii]